MYWHKAKMGGGTSWVFELDSDGGVWPKQNLLNHVSTSGVARAFSGGRLTHPENQNEEKNK